ncbi:MAG: hypothetical protein AAFV74_23040 [Pseudomonadota bacterium]
MGRILRLSLVVLGAVAAVGGWHAIGGFFDHGVSGAQHSTTQMEKTLADYPPDLMIRFPDAPKPVLDLAATILSGEAPSLEAIQTLTPELLNRTYVTPSVGNLPWMQHSLLREAVQQANAPAARALITAGADPFFNRGEMPFLAARTASGGRDRVFPDYSDANAMIEMWFEAGGDPNATWEGAGGSLLLLELSQANLEGVLLVLERGADPWRRVPIGRAFGDTPRMTSMPFLLRTANANPFSSEIAFRVALAGYYRGGSVDDLSELDALYEMAAEQYLGSTGDENLHLVWQMQKAITEIYRSLERDVPDRVAALLAMQIPADVGGFWLAPGEVRSPDEPDQVVTNDTQLGNELWNGR